MSLLLCLGIILNSVLGKWLYKAQIHLLNQAIQYIQNMLMVSMCRAYGTECTVEYFATDMSCLRHLRTGCVEECIEHNCSNTQQNNNPKKCKSATSRVATTYLLHNLL